MNNLANIDNRLRMILKSYKLKTKINIKDKKISVAFLNMPWDSTIDFYVNSYTVEKLYEKVIIKS